MSDDVKKAIQKQDRRIEQSKKHVLKAFGLATEEYSPETVSMVSTPIDISDEEFSELIEKAKQVQEYERIAASLTKNSKEISNEAVTFRKYGMVLSTIFAIIAAIAAIMIGNTGGVALALTLILFVLVFIYFIMAQSNMIIHLAQIESRLEDLIKK